jgi:hypothetical protein
MYSTMILSWRFPADISGVGLYTHTTQALVIRRYLFLYLTRIPTSARIKIKQKFS